MLVIHDKSISVYESALWRTTSTVIETEEMILIVDPNWLPEEIERIRIDVAGRPKELPRVLLFTHSDYDHVMGYGAFPEAQVITSKAMANDTNRQTVIDAVLDWDDGYYIDRPYDIRFPQADWTPGWNETMNWGNTRLTFYPTRGHTADGLLTVVESPALSAGPVIVAGDYLSNVEFPYLYDSFTKYRETLDLFAAQIDRFAPQMLIPGHGDLTTSEQEMHLRLMDSKWYLEQLERSVCGKTPFPEEALWKHYRFPRGMKAFHEANRKLLEKELEHGVE